MSIIDRTEINVNYKLNDIKYAISKNQPIENKLNVIIVVSNPCLYSRRYVLLREFVKRIEEQEENVELFIVELIYKNQQFSVTNEKNKNHLQLRTDTPLWHKENMINLGVKYLLPDNWKAFAWVDADIEFENNSWALDTLKILNGCKDVVQLFSHCVDMSKEETNLNLFNGFGYSFTKNKTYCAKGLDYWHPGFAWAMTRSAYEKIGGIYDKGVLGSGDSVMALSFFSSCEQFINKNYTEDYNNSMLEFQKNAKNLKLGYTPGVIRHHYHGSKINRKYTDRWKILMKYSYSPIQHLKYNETGIIIPSKSFPEEFKKDIMEYFKERKEDD
jgi:hypothetical protein